MSLPNYLSNIKSSGIYRFVWDKSEIPGVQADTLRLVVGYSDRGPFNTPVYVKDAAEFKSIYGNVSKKLERYGSWFHRMSIQALKRGPILALNLKPFTKEGKDAEVVEGVSFNPQTALGKKIALKVEEIYNTARFWTLEPENFEINEQTKDQYISIFATDSAETSNTIFIRGFQPKGYDVTFKTWYSSVLNGESLPPYLEGHDNDMLSQYFAEIYVFRGEFTKAIVTNDKLSKYFDVKGDNITLKPYLLNAFNEKVDTLEALAANDASNFIKSYQGILLPEFLSSTNTVISLDAQFNQDNYLHKMMMHFNQAALYEGLITADMLDTTGFLQAELDDPTKNPSFMSLTALDPQVSVVTCDAEGNWTYGDVEGATVDMYKFQGLTIEAVENDAYSVIINKEVGNTGIRKGDRFRINVEDTTKEQPVLVPQMGSLVDVTKFETSLTRAIRGIDGPKGKFNSSVVKDATPKHLNGFHMDYFFTPSMMFEAVPGPTTVADTTYDIARFFESYHKETKAEYVWYANTERDYTAGNVKRYKWNPESTLHCKYDKVDAQGQFITKGGKNITMVSELVNDTMMEIGQALLKPELGNYLAKPMEEAWKVTAPHNGISMPTKLEDFSNPEVQKFLKTSEFKDAFIEAATLYINSEIVPEEYKHVYVMIESGDTVTTNYTAERINIFYTPVIELPKDNDLEYRYKYTFNINAEQLIGTDNLIKCVNSITYTSANLAPTYVKGYTFMSGKPASTKQIDKLKWQHKILDVLGYKGIRIALTSRVDIDYRYIVDTFESFVEGNCKARITSIAKEKDNAFALVNFPAMSNFAKCEYTSYADNNGLFDTKYIPMGGNPQKVMGQVFTLASEEDGSSYASYNTCLSMKDVNTGIKFTCPSAALVSNLYMEKYTKYFPYTIIAGPNRAVIHENGLIGPDFNFSREDLDNLEPFGVNCMVMVPGKGTYINSNQTAKQNPVTTLSKINVRELCIFLQDEIEHLLQQYQWDFNTPNLRSTIKDRADVILETAKNNGGVYAYLNVCDESNNTDDVINNEMFVLSTSIEPGIGAGKMVQELTLYRKGGMSSLIKD